MPGGVWIRDIIDLRVMGVSYSSWVIFVRACRNLSLHNGLIGYDGKIWLGSNLALQSSVCCTPLQCYWRSHQSAGYLPSDSSAFPLAYNEIRYLTVGLELLNLSSS